MARLPPASVTLPVELTVLPINFVVLSATFASRATTLAVLTPALAHLPVKLAILSVSVAYTTGNRQFAARSHRQRMLRDDFDARSTQLYIERDGDIAGVLRIIWGRDGLPPAYVNWYGLARFQPFPPSEISFTGRMMVAEKYRSSPLAASLAPVWTEAYNRAMST